jgi:hypothetical protein
VNEKCKKDPLNSMNAILATIDGDFACDEKCLKEYEKQKKEFFENIGDDEWYEKWLNGEV